MFIIFYNDFYFKHVPFSEFKPNSVELFGKIRLFRMTLTIKIKCLLKGKKKSHFSTNYNWYEL